jgi:hypothetical protein
VNEHLNQATTADGSGGRMWASPSSKMLRRNREKGQNHRQTICAVFLVFRFSTGSDYIEAGGGGCINISVRKMRKNKKKEKSGNAPFCSTKPHWNNNELFRFFPLFSRNSSSRYN